MPRAAALPLDERHEGNHLEEVRPVVGELPPPRLADDLRRVDFFVRPHVALVARGVEEDALEHVHVAGGGRAPELRLVPAQSVTKLQQEIAEASATHAPRLNDISTRLRSLSYDLMKYMGCSLACAGRMQ